MNTVLKVLVVFLITATAFAKSGSIEVSGTISNHGGSTITITNFDYQELASATIDEQGNFKTKARIENGFYLLNYGRESSYVYLYPGDQLQITFDALYFEKTLKFTGIGAERNNYLIKKSLADAAFTKDVEAFYKVEESTYIKNLEKVKEAHLQSLTGFNVEDFFVVEEKKSLKYDYLLGIQNYASSYKFYLGEEIKPSESFYKPLESVDLNNDEDFKTQPFYRYLVNSIWSKRIKKGKNVEEMLDVLRKVKSEPVLISLVNGFYSKISSEKDRGKDYFQLIKKVAGNNKAFVDAARKKLKETQAAMGLSAGETSPSFDYMNAEGDKVSLESFKGKYVYIDVWATWCGPCIKQIPYLKKLEERYQGKNIAFVSISVDKKEVEDKWRKMIANKNLGGTQLFADNSFDSAFMEAFGVNSIPRFIIIDPEGKILDSEAPRPSYEKTRTLLDSFVK